MPLTIHADALPLRVDDTGTVRVGKTRVLFHLVVREFQGGASPEEIVRAYDALNLADVYAVIAYYLRHKVEVEVYLAEYDQQAAELRKQIEARQGSSAGMRQRLLTRRVLREMTSDEADAIETLTGYGETPLERFALIDGTIRSFIPSLGWLPTIVEDNHAAERCNELLRRMGREYKSINDIPVPQV